MFHLGGPLAKVDSSAKFGVVVFKASMLYSLELGPSARVGSSANFGVLVFKAFLLYYPGGPLAKVCLSAKFGVVVFNASILDSLGVSRPLCSITHGVHWAKYVYLPSLV